jgi:sRNA-binding carbon storage regulator CsrA
MSDGDDTITRFSHTIAAGSTLNLDFGGRPVKVRFDFAKHRGNRVRVWIAAPRSVRAWFDRPDPPPPQEFALEEGEALVLETSEGPVRLEYLGPHRAEGDEADFGFEAARHIRIDRAELLEKAS